VARNYGAGGHGLSEVNAESRTAQCNRCGPVRIHRHGISSWRCATHSREYTAAWRKLNPKTTRRHSAWSHYKTQYGLSPEEYGSLFIDQNYECGICGASLLDRKAVIDHDHVTGRVRGLLCSPCNGAEGWFVNHYDKVLAWQERGR
jgi:ribosomal protein L37AE/L43A